MEFLTYALSSLAVFSGIGFGILLSKIAPEEMSDGEKYLVFSFNMIFGIIMYFMAASLGLGLLAKLTFGLLGFFALTYIRIKKAFLYPLMAVPFYLSYGTSYFLVQSCLIGFSGMILASLAIKRKKAAGLLIYTLFVLLSLIMFLVKL